jgi:hypothetical protein
LWCGVLVDAQGALGVSGLGELFPDRYEAARLVLDRNHDFLLLERATHVLQEAQRVLDFEKVGGWILTPWGVRGLFRAGAGG